MAAEQWAKAESEVAHRRLTRTIVGLQKAALVSRGKPKGIDPGYVHIEIGDLIMWLVKKNHGLDQIIADAVGELARSQFLQVVGVGGQYAN